MQVLQVVQGDATFFISCTCAHAHQAGPWVRLQVDEAIGHERGHYAHHRTEPGVVDAELHIGHALCFVNCTHKHHAVAEHTPFQQAQRLFVRLTLRRHVLPAVLLLHDACDEHVMLERVCVSALVVVEHLQQVDVPVSHVLPLFHRLRDNLHNLLQLHALPNQLLQERGLSNANVSLHAECETPPGLLEGSCAQRSGLLRLTVSCRCIAGWPEELYHLLGLARA
mmetsp:Transcript_33463/g.85496  ORF Transcript_33463/g.85496 Transcript_33463/m.85496 type:complete len:224 (+) Transcript_33463:525-1196(+)